MNFLSRIFSAVSDAVVNAASTCRPSGIRVRSLGIAAALSAGLWSASGFSYAYEPALNPYLNEQVVMIPAISGAGSVELQTTIFKPPGEGPFPLLVMNHGKEAGNPHLQSRDRFLVLSREFVRRGYAVIVPMRKGFAASTGTYSEYSCDMRANGQVQADDLHSVLEYALHQPWIDRDRIVVAGQSYGGLATMAFGTRQYPGVRGLINFAGGLRTTGGCHWRSSLVQAMKAYGQKGDIPSLWFYGQNDAHFDHDLAFKMHDAYVSAGGKATLIAYGPFRDDAHAMVGSRDGVSVWWPETEKFLSSIGMPTDTVVALQEPAPIPPSDYAALEDLKAIPYIEESGREAYRTFLSKALPRAFAVAPNGVWSWAEEGDDPVERVLANCARNSKQTCKLYAVNDYVVWTDQAPPVLADNGKASASVATSANASSGSAAQPDNGLPAVAPVAPNSRSNGG